MDEAKKTCGSCAMWESFWCGVKGLCKHTCTSARVESCCPHWETRAEEPVGAASEIR